MVLKSLEYSGQISGGGTHTFGGSSPTIQDGGYLKQVSITLERASHFRGKEIRKSRIGIDDGTRHWLPRIHEVNKSQSSETFGSTIINVTSFNNTVKVYGYYAVFDTEFDGDFDILLQNGDKNRTANYDCIVLYK